MENSLLSIFGKICQSPCTIVQGLLVIGLNFGNFHTSIPNNTTLFLLLSALRTSSTSGITIENLVFSNTFALEMSISLTVLPSPTTKGSK